jgi:murein tripeptide amidase MpaA
VLHESVELIVMPLVNVDGYEFSRLDGERYQRKNRRPPPSYIPRSNTACWGVDLNRNFPQHFGGRDASESPCDQNYRCAALSSVSCSPVGALQHELRIWAYSAP